MNLSFNISDLIALVALLISAYAAITTARFNSRQKSLVESQDRLNKLLLEKELGASEETKRADIGSSIIRLGNNSYRLKIWNKGKSAARNVSVKFPEGNGLVPEALLNQTFPLEVLEPHGSVDIPALVGMQTKRKHVIELTWSDDFSETNKKLTYPTL